MAGVVSLQNSVETGHEDMIVSATIRCIKNNVQVSFLAMYIHKQ